MMDYNDGLLPEPCLRMDTHFGDEYESVEFGDGTGYVKAAPTLARLGALHVELDELRDENAKLREERDMYRDLVGMMDHPDLNAQLQAENAKLRDSLKALMMGTYAELCADRDEPQCRECSMSRGDDTCVTADAMELLGIDMYGEPLGIEVDE